MVKVAHDAHLGGALFGILFVLLIDVNKGVEFLSILIDYGICYINNNGIILPDSSPTIMPKNRAYMYGDGVLKPFNHEWKTHQCETMFQGF